MYLDHELHISYIYIIYATLSQVIKPSSQSFPNSRDHPNIDAKNHLTCFKSTAWTNPLNKSLDFLLKNPRKPGSLWRRWPAASVCVWVLSRWSVRWFWPTRSRCSPWSSCWVPGLKKKDHDGQFVGPPSDGNEILAKMMLHQFFFSFLAEHVHLFWRLIMKLTRWCPWKF